MFRDLLGFFICFAFIHTLYSTLVFFLFNIRLRLESLMQHLVSQCARLCVRVCVCWTVSHMHTCVLVRVYLLILSVFFLMFWNAVNILLNVFFFCSFFPLPLVFWLLTHFFKHLVYDPPENRESCCVTSSLTIRRPLHIMCFMCSVLSDGFAW